MRRAIALGAAHHPHPNPRVGAVILGPGGEVLAEGAHQGPGQPHAEQAAIDRLEGRVPPGSTLVVSLEPCNHQARTPPCTEAVIRAGFARVVVGAIDPDRRVSGKGIETIRSAGIETEQGLLADAIESSDPAYFHHRRTGRAHLTVKTAMTIDGQIAARDGSSMWITSPEARADAHLLRAEADAVAIGAGTLRTDDPGLDVRRPGFEGPQPVAVVVAGTRELPPERRVWKRPGTVVLATSPVNAPVEVVVVEAGPAGWPDPAAVAVALGDRGLLAVLVEGGSRLLTSLWKSRVVDAGVSYLGALMAGGVGTPVFSGPWETLADATRVEITEVRNVGTDVRVDWHPVRSHPNG
jgi:diaminohydroxyphosphoribosylaminopyrimidine deaminase/5-amino-6-(5-phosphoribosylamino)uracil reductase